MGWANIVLKKRKDTLPLYCVPMGLDLLVSRFWKCFAKK